MTTITVDRAVLEQALEALGDPWKAGPEGVADAITALRAALAQQEQEPVAWVDEASIAWLTEHPRGIITTRLVLQKSPERQIPLYTAPPRRDALAQQEQEPAVFTVTKTGALLEWEPTVGAFELPDGKHSLYLHPPRREWQSLSGEEVKTAIGASEDFWAKSSLWITSIARAIEAALKEKNVNG